MIRPADNPFRTHCIDSLHYHMDDDAWHALRDRMFRLGCRGAIIGPHGAGKSTLLRRIDQALEEAGIPAVACLVNEEVRCNARAIVRQALDLCGPGTVLLLDGQEQLSALHWHQLRIQTRGIKGLIITRHTPGGLPELFHCTTTPALASELVAQLVPRGSAELRDAAQHAWQRHQGNMRNVFFDLYDHCAAAPVQNKRESQQRCAHPN